MLALLWSCRSVLRRAAGLRLLPRGLFDRSFLHATVPQPVPSWTPADCKVRPRSGAIRPTPIKSVRSSCGTPSRSIIRISPGPKTRSRGHIELAGSRRDSHAVRRRINTVTKVDWFSPSWGHAILEEPDAEDRATVGTDPSAAPGLEEE